jgi:hypothetical protein
MISFAAAKVSTKPEPAKPIKPKRIEPADHPELHPEAWPEAKNGDHGAKIFKPVAVQSAALCLGMNIRSGKTEVFRPVSDNEKT